MVSLVFFARAILSWFPISYDSPFAPVRNAVYNLTEPVLAPIRSALPRTGGFDFSVIIVLVFISFVLTPLAASI